MEKIKMELTRTFLEKWVSENIERTSDTEKITTGVLTRVPITDNCRVKFIRRTPGRPDMLVLGFLTDCPNLQNKEGTQHFRCEIAKRLAPSPSVKDFLHKLKRPPYAL
ncbi:uncharacterized protein [Montipora foliosa]|uniref:uncharacterized protein n=1 Tax=Montipora foliosa TaxID=591990 RepID=UPI0035F14175